MVKYPDSRSERQDSLMLMTAAHTTLPIDAASAAKFVTRGQGFDWELLSASVIALAVRCAQ